MIGPTTDPCGTPYETDEGVELVVDERTYWVRPFEYDLNQPSTIPLRPYDICSRWSKMSWSTLLKAAGRSNSVKTARLPGSRASKMSASTLSTAVSVEWCALYADWRFNVLSIVSHVRHKLLSNQSFKQLGQYGQVADRPIWLMLSLTAVDERLKDTLSHCELDLSAYGQRQLCAKFSVRCLINYCTERQD